MELHIVGSLIKEPVAYLDHYPITFQFHVMFLTSLDFNHMYHLLLSPFYCYVENLDYLNTEVLNRIWFYSVMKHDTWWRSCL